MHEDISEHDRQCYEELIAKPRSLEWKRQVVNLVSRDGWRCMICNKTIDAGEEYEIDHTKPRYSQGGNALRNLRLVHKECNLKPNESARKRSGRELIEFLQRQAASRGIAPKKREYGLPLTVHDLCEVGIHEECPQNKSEVEFCGCTCHKTEVTE